MTRVLLADFLDQQWWCFGCDIRRKQGNLLLQYGFNRLSPPPGEAGSSMYSRAGGPYRWQLWGFGVSVERPPGLAIFVRRYAFAPEILCSLPQPGLVWRPEQLGPLRSPVTAEQTAVVEPLLRALFRLLALYEAWVQRAVGVSYRARCLSQWHKPRVVPARAVAPAWRSLAQHLDLTSVVSTKEINFD